MASNWKKIELGEIASIIGGGTPSSKIDDYWEGDIPWITPKDLSNHPYKLISRGSRNITQLGLEKSSARLMPAGTLLISSRAPIGYTAIAKNELCTSQGFKSLILKDGYSSDFFYYLIKGNISKLEAVSSGSTFKEISGSTLKKISFIVPPLPEQKLIANILGSLDNKIELNRQMNETLEAMAQALFKSWFIDFDPVIDNALAAGNAIPDELLDRAEQRKGIEKKDSPDIQNLFPNEFEFTEEMGWIPKGWVNEPLSSFIEKSNTGADAIQKAPIVDYDTGIKCARIGDFSNNRDIASWGFSNVTAENFEKFKLLKGDILITRTSILGLSKIILEDLSAVYNNGLIRIRVNTNPIYVYQAFQTKEFRTYIDRITGESSTRPNMKISYLLEYPLLHPSTKLL